MEEWRISTASAATKAARPRVTDQREAKAPPLRNRAPASAQKSAMAVRTRGVPAAAHRLARRTPRESESPAQSPRPHPAAPDQLLDILHPVCSGHSTVFPPGRRLGGPECTAQSEVPTARRAFLPRTPHAADSLLLCPAQARGLRSNPPPLGLGKALTRRLLRQAVPGTLPETFGRPPGAAGKGTSRQPACPGTAPELPLKCPWNSIPVRFY